jgi:hypothetical protein
MGWVKSIFAIPYNALHFDFSEKRAVPNADKKLLEDAADLFVRRWQHRRSANQESYSASPGVRRNGVEAELGWNLAARAASRRSNCKGPPGLPCAVTPQGTWPPAVPSKLKHDHKPA